MADPAFQEVMKFVLDTREYNQRVDELVKGWALTLSKLSKNTKDAKPFEDIEKELKKAVSSVTKGYEEMAKTHKKFIDRQASEEAYLVRQKTKLREQERRDEMRAYREREREEELALRATLRRAEQERAERARIYAAMRRDETARATQTGMPVAAGGGLAGNRALRIGAGLAGMTGNYQVASGMYAAANIPGLSGISIPTGAAVGAGAAIGAGALGIGILGYGRELNIELAKMSTLLLPASAGTVELSKAMSDASDSAARLSSRFNVDIVDIVKAYKEALSSGIEAGDLERFGKVAGTLSKALGEDFGKSVNLLTTFKDTYGATITDLDKFNDILFNVVDVGKVNVSQLLHNFGRLMPVGKSAGIAIDDLAAAFATLSRQMTVPQATTGLLNAIRDIMNPSEKNAAAFREYGIMFGQMAFEGRTFLQVIEDIHKKTGGSGEAIGKLFSDVQSSRAIQSLTTTLDLYRQMPSAIANTETAIVAANRAQNTFWENLGRDYNAFSNVLQKLGSSLGNRLNDMIYGGRNERERSIGSRMDMYKYIYSLGYDPTKGIGMGRDITGKLTEHQLESFTTADSFGKRRFTPDFHMEYEDYFKRKKAEIADTAEKKSKADSEAKDAIEAQLKLKEDEMSKRSLRLRLAELNERMTPEQKDKYQSLQAGLESYKDKSEVSVYNKWMTARHGITDKAALGKINETYTYDMQLREDEIKKHELAIKEFEDQVLQQREYKDILKEEALARKQATHILRKETQDKQQAIRDEIEKLREYKADLKDIPARKAGYKYTQTGALINGKPQKIGAWDPGQSAVSYEAQRDAVDARIDVLQKQLYGLGQSVQEVTFQLTNSANGMSTATSAFFAAGQAAINNIANFMTQQTVSVVGANQIDTEKTIDAVRNGLEKAKRNGTNKSNYQKKSTVPTVNTGNGTMISGGKLYQMVNGVWTDPILYEPSGRIDNSR